MPTNRLKLLSQMSAMTSGGSPIPVIMGFDPMVQVIHEEDVAQAIVLSLEPGVRGIMNLTGPGEVPLSVILAELNKPTLCVPFPAFSA